jgi:transposase-like protein
MKKEVTYLFGTGFRDLVLCRSIYKRKRVSAFIIDETVIQIGNNQHFWLWICIEPVHRSILGINISEERNICL